MTTVYVASKTRLAPIWQDLRDMWRPSGIEIISTWIDEAGEGETSDFPGLWQRCIGESSRADFLIAVHEPGDVWKGAFIEIGSALASGRTVLLVGDPPGTWMEHYAVRRVPTISHALDYIIDIKGIRNG